MRFRVFALVAAIMLGGKPAPPACAQPDIALQEEKAFAAAVKKVNASVVQLETIGGLDRVGERRVGSGPFTAVVLDNEGYLISSQFNFVHQPAAIFVKLPEGRRVAAEKIAEDESRKLTLLKIEPDSGLVPIELANQSELAVGQTTIAVGRVYDIQSPNISTGILSATDRIWGRAVQTDAKISPANFGGPLINLRGQMIGLLTPLSPNDDNLLAGSEWYDSGIGFAVPLDPVLKRLDQLKSGQNLVAGKLGVSLEGSDLYSDPAKIAFCQGTSPAAFAGIRSGDTIVEINGKPIIRQAQMRHALGPLYAEETISIVVRRKENVLSFNVELAATIEPFEPVALGILVRDPVDGESEPPNVAHVLADSPAQAAGLLAGDRIVSLGEVPVATSQGLRGAILAAIGSTVEIAVKRNGEVLNFPITLGAQSAQPIQDWDPTPADSTRVLEINVPEFANRTFAIVPDSTQPTSLTGCMVWVAQPGVFDQNAFLESWKNHVQMNNVCVLVVQSKGKKSWTPGEAEFIRRAVELLRNQVALAGGRIAIGGSKSGGAMAALTAFKHRDLFRGLATVDSQVPQRLPGLETSAVNSMLICFGMSAAHEDADELLSQAESLKDKKFPVHIELGGPRNPSDWAARILHWVQTVDRM